MFEKIKKLFKRQEEAKEQEKEVKAEEKVEPQEPKKGEKKKEASNVRPLTPKELELFKQGMGITPHNYWQWASRTNNFKLLTDGKYVWVEGYEDHIGKSLPLTQQRAWSWDFIRERLRDFGQG